MSNVIPFGPRERIGAAVDIILDQKLDHRKWQCGNCGESMFHLWCDGVVACAICGRETLGMRATYTESK